MANALNLPFINVINIWLVTFFKQLTLIVCQEQHESVQVYVLLVAESHLAARY